MTSASPRTRPLDHRLGMLWLLPLVGLVLFGVALVVLVLTTSWPGVGKLLACLGVVLVAGVAGLVCARSAASIRSSLERLRSDARRTVEETLPASIQRLRVEGPGSARSVSTAVEPEADDQLGDVAEAFNELHATAVRVAAEQAALRANLDSIVVNLSRRTQTLIERQLVEITDLEAGEADPDRLGQLFRIDHLATRVRRHAESLLVLAGVEERRTTKAAPALDVARIAVGEVEQYQRVRFSVVPGDLVAAGAVDDVAHMVAELIDNATEFSPPEAEVRVSGVPLIGGGLRIEIADTGIGMKPDQLETLNARLREGGELDVASSRTLGLYVVSRLAARHGIGVRLVAGPERGTLAQIDLPARLLVNALEVEPQPADAPTATSRAAVRAADQSPARGTVAPTRASRSTPAPTPSSAATSTAAAARRSQTPLFSSVESAWFSPDTATDWSGSTDAGWQRAADALRAAEQASTPATAPSTASTPGFTTESSTGRSTESENLFEASRPAPARDAWTAGGEPGPAASHDEPILSAAGLPKRRRGAALAPGSLSRADSAPDSASAPGNAASTGPGTGMGSPVPPQQRHRPDANAVSGVLSTLQAGVSQARSDAAGWVPGPPTTGTTTPEDGDSSPGESS